MSEQINCAKLEAIKRRLARDGEIIVPEGTSLAKLAIIRSLGPVIISSDTSKDELTLEKTSATLDQRLIKEALAESSNSPCWMRKVGCLVVDENNWIVIRGHNHPVIDGDFCQGLTVDSKEIFSLLSPGERLDFCQGIHDVEDAITQAAVSGMRIARMKWYLSLEPCEPCANSLVCVRPSAVFLPSSSKNYYNSTGLERLIAAGIPVMEVELE